MTDDADDVDELRPSLAAGRRSSDVRPDSEFHPCELTREGDEAEPVESTERVDFVE